MAKKKREFLKFREGDCGLKIRKDGKLEVAGIDEAGGMIDKNGMVNPVLLFASAWARKDPKCFEALVHNFKESVREGYFGPDAKRDYERALKVQEEEVKKPDPPFLNPDTKPSVTTTAVYGDEFETSSSKTPLDKVKETYAPTEEDEQRIACKSPSHTLAYGDEFETSSSKPTVSTTAAASGAVTFEKPQPLTTDEAVNRRSE